MLEELGRMADPFPTYTRLRESAPVHRTTTPDGAAVWLVTRHQDVREALSDPRLGLDKASSGGGYVGFSLPPALDANLLNLDPPDHTRVRRLIVKAFTPHRVEGLRPGIREITERLLGAVPADGEVDLIAALAAPLPVTVIGGLLGVPAHEMDDFHSWTTTLVAPRTPADAQEALTSLTRYLVTLIAHKRARPGDDLVSAMISARDDEDRLSENELTSLAFLTLWAGYETTVHLIGNSLLAVLEDPALRERARDESGAERIVEETLRLNPPLPFGIRRFATVDLTIADVRVPAGDTVLLCLASAHRDPRRYQRPDHFDPDREDGAHLGFGRGIHYCIGAPLARMQAVIALTTTLRRFPALSLAAGREDLSWHPSFRLHGLRALPART